jgi:hypothetical protein
LRTISGLRPVARASWTMPLKPVAAFDKAWAPPLRPERMSGP